MKTKFYLRDILILLSASTSLQAAVPGKVTTEWVGNTFGFSELIDPNGSKTDPMNRMWVQNYIANIWVSKDGKVFTYSSWDEGARASGIYQNGKVLGQLMFGKDIFGFNGDLIGDSKYVYTTTVVDWENWDRHGFGIQRYTHDGRPAGWATGRGAMKSYLVVHETGKHPTISRLAIDTVAKELYLFDSLTAGGSVLVYDLTTMSETPKATWKVSNVDDLTSDNAGNVWVIQNKKIVKFTSRGVATGKVISSIAEPTRLALDQKGRLMVYDDSTLQIHFFADVNGNPVEQATFGAKGGIYSGIKGKVTPDKLLPKTAGMGTDSAGNIYMAWGGVIPVAGSDIRSYAPDGAMKWHIVGHTFVACGGFDPASDGRDIYYRDHHYTVDYTKGTGKKWKYESFLWDRATDTPSVFGGAVIVRNLGGKKFLASTWSDQGAGGYKFYRMEQQVAVPAGSVADGSWGWWIEPGGNIWNADGWGQIKRFKFLGLDAAGNPKYNIKAPDTFPRPVDVEAIQRLHYSPTSDAMFFTGYDKANPRPEGEWGRAGSVFARYDGWTAGTRKLAWKIVLPRDNWCQALGDGTLKDIWIEGDYAFFVTGVSSPATTVYVFSIKDGSLVGTILPGPEISGDIDFTGSMGGLGYVDMVGGMQVYKRTNGEYQILIEDDVHAKNVWYHWCPVGTCAERTAGTVAPETATTPKRTMTVDLRKGRVVIPGGLDLFGRTLP